MRKPWQSDEFLEWFDSILKKDDLDIFEFGSGYSTIWLEKRARRLVSVEHDIRWYEKLKNDLENTHYIFSHPESYHRTIHNHSPFDVIIVDGIYRVRCIREAIKSARPGCLIILDDSEKDKYKEIKREMQQYVYKTFRDDEKETIVWKL